MTVVTDTRSRPLLIVVGQTASGKSDLGIALAHKLGGEIINADSMALYRGMDIGTAKVTLAERGRTRHHLLDIWDLRHPASVAEYQGLARSLVDDVHARGVVPIVVGGSGLYIRALCDDLAFPGTDPEVRGRWEKRLEHEGPESLHAELVRRDPLSAESIQPANGRRMVRALEVIEITGRPYTATLPAPEALYDATFIGLDVDRTLLAARIEARVDRMWALGFVDEVRGLEADGLRDGITARRAVGYAQVLRYLAGEIDEAEARAETLVATRSFARRQLKWFGREPRIRWLPYDAPDLLDQALNLVADKGEVLRRKQ